MNTPQPSNSLIRHQNPWGDFCEMAVEKMIEWINQMPNEYAKFWGDKK
jgi:hypothetical protein